MKANRLLLLLLIISLGLLLVACTPKAVYHIVKFDSNGGTAVQDIAIESENLLGKPNDPERVGYTFLGWYNGETLWDFENNTVTSDITLKAKWERIIYTVTFDSNGGTSTAQQTVGLGDYVTPPQAPSKDGFSFKGWYSDDVAWDFKKTPITKDITLTAKWNKLSYTVSYDANGGNNTPSETVLHGESATVPTVPTKQNHRFIGWYFGDLLWDFAANKITSNMTLVARWESTILTRTVNFMTSDTETYVTRHVVDGTKLEAPTDPTKQNYRFLGWYLGETLWNFENNTVTSDITLKAKWEAFPTHEVKFTVAEGQIYDTRYVVNGEKVTAPTEPTKQGHRFVGWYFGQIPWDFDNYTVTSDITLKAKWEAFPTHEVKFTVAEGQIYDTRYVVNGEKVTAPTEPTKQGHRFVGWYFGQIPWDFDNYTVSSDITLVAKWESGIVTHAVTFMYSDIVLCDTRHVIDGTKLSPPSLPQSKAAKFLGWYLGEEKFDFENSTITGSITLTAKWSVKGYTVHFDTNGGTPVAPVYILEGELIEPPETTMESCSVQCWTCLGEEWDFSVSPTSNMWLIAVWAIDLPPHEF